MRLIQEGPRNARIVLVGEAPGEHEDREGRPFVGSAGHILDKILDRAGIRRSECFVTNVCHHRPPKNKFEWFFTKDGQPHLLRGMLQLKKDLLEIKPNLVVALGAQPLKVLTGKHPISDWRGSLLPSGLAAGLKTIGTFHPAGIMRQWDYKAIAEFDMIRAKQESEFPEIRYPQRTLYLPDNIIARRNGTEWEHTEATYDAEAIAYEMSQAEVLSLDIETFMTDNGWRLACIGFSDRPDRALVIKATPGTMPTIRMVCEAPNKKVMQNGAFDYSVLYDEGITIPNFWWDTMLAHHTLYAESSGGGDETATLLGKKRTAGFAKGLAFQTSIYTREPYYKMDGKAWKETSDLPMFWRYNALDAAVTREIQIVQEKELAEFGVAGVFHEAMSLLPYALEATRTGILIDTKVREEMKVEAQNKVDNLQAFVNKIAGESINVKSNPQMVALLYDKLKLPKRHGKSGGLTANKDVLVELGHKTQNPVLHSIIQLRQQRDVIERYLNANIGSDLRMRCSFDLTGTRSGRLSSRQSLDGTGTNLQNIPSDLRRMFVSDPGTVFVYRDYSQAEARVVAYLARCEGLIELFEDSTRDVHTENAARIFGKSPAVLEKNGGPVTSVERYLAKRVIHASNYGMEAKRLVEVVNEDAATTGVRIVLSDAKRLIEKYFLLFPEIQQNFWREVEVELRHTRTLSTPFGWRRAFYGRWDDKLLREAYSFIPQSTVGHLARIAWRRISDRLVAHPLWGAEVLLNVHDSILVQCDEGVVHEVVHAMKQEMDISMTLGDYTFKIPTDCQVGYNWGPHDAETNPRGLKEWDD